MHNACSEIIVLASRDASESHYCIMLLKWSQNKAKIFSLWPEQKRWSRKNWGKSVVHSFELLKERCSGRSRIARAPYQRENAKGCARTHARFWSMPLKGSFDRYDWQDKVVLQRQNHLIRNEILSRYVPVMTESQCRPWHYIICQCQGRHSKIIILYHPEVMGQS